MSYRENELKAERIRKNGITSDLPLFEDNLDCPMKLPDWIWDGTAIKADAYMKVKEKLSERCMIYLKAMLELGGKATDNEVEKKSNMPVHLVAARRNNLMEFGIIFHYPTAEKKLGPYGQPNIVWYVRFNKLRELLKL